MPYAELTITIPDGVWIGRLSRRFPEARFRVLAATADDVGVVRLDVIAPEPRTVVEEMRDCEPVTTLTVFEETDGHCRVQFESSVAVVLSAVQRSGVPIETPFEVKDGQLELTTTTPRERLSTLGETLETLGISYTLERVSEGVESEGDLLTDRQRRLLERAREHGYYDTPRRITLTELAEECDLAASTCSEVLHRAEERLVKEHLDEVDAPAPGTQPVGAD